MLSQHFIIVIVIIYLSYRCDRLHGHSEIKLMWHNKDTSEYYDIYSPWPFLWRAVGVGVLGTIKAGEVREESRTEEQRLVF